MKLRIFLLVILLIAARQNVQGDTDSLSVHDSDSSQSLGYTDFLEASDTIIPGRLIPVSIAATGIYVGSLIGFNETWYKKEAKSPFHFYDDRHNWMQMDKLGHVYGGYFQSKIMIDVLRWTGVPRKKSILIGGLSGIAYQSIIEILDGYSADWGFSWYDMAANSAGALMAMGQEYAWDEQRIVMKFSVHRVSYTGEKLMVANDKYGTTLPSRILKDYNGQTYWLSVNPKSFMKNRESKMPGWLNIALGTGAEGMFGGDSNSWYDEDGERHFIATPRYRQWYLSPDIDFTRIPTRHKGLQFAFMVMNILKMPMPTLEMNRVEGLQFHWLYY